MAPPYNPTADPVGPFETTTAFVRGFADNVPLDHNLFLALSTTPGGPYNAAVSLPLGGAVIPGQVITAQFQNLAPGSTYYFRTEVRNAAGVRVQVSDEATFQTLAGPSDGIVGGLVAAPCCAATGTEPVDGMTFEFETLCDTNLATGTVYNVVTRRAQYDADGNLVGYEYFDVPTGDPWVPMGEVTTCDISHGPQPVILCEFKTDGTVTEFTRFYTGLDDGTILITNTSIDGDQTYQPLPDSRIGLCDPYTVCTPNGDVNISAECGPAESPDKTIVESDVANPLANAVYVDDATADGLCGGTWAVPAATLSAPFPVNESFRNATFDQPGPVTQGTPPYPQLTAPVDGAGAGWLQMSDMTSGTNAVWQVPSAFPTSQGMNAAITFTSHDGTTPGGDGMVFVFTDGAGPPQATTIGGFGNLGLQNWDGGYFAIVLDEYGQTTSCAHSAPGTIDPAAGPCGFQPNSISLQLAGAARQTATCSCCVIASAPTAPNALNLTTRFKPARLLVSVIAEGGQTYVSVSVDWNDGNGPVQYFERENVTACAGPAPASLRMAAYGGSGGSYRAVKEIRDAVARPAGVSNWRAFSVLTDPVPECATLVNITASVDVTFNSDTQTAANGDPEAYLFLVNDSTNEILARAVRSSNPSQIGTAATLTFTEAVDPDQVPFLRVYVGAESRDQNGEYDSLWENLTVSAVATGCPATPVRTIRISADCPIPVTIVGGSADGGGGGGTTVVNTPSTFEDAPICATVSDGVGGFLSQPAFRREVHLADGSSTVTFLGTDGLAILPTTWEPGLCPPADREAACWTQTSTGAQIHTGTIRHDDALTAPGWILFDQNNLPVSPTEPGLTFVPCGQSDPIATTGLCLPGGTPIATVVRRNTTDGTLVQDGWINLLTGTFTSGNPPVGTIACGDTTSITTSGLLCDVDGGGNVVGLVIVQYEFNPDGSVASTTLLNAVTGAVYVPTGTVTVCPTGTEQPDADLVVLCDDNGSFLRDYRRDETGTVVAVSNYTVAGSPYVPVGTVGSCAGRDQELQILCDSTPTRFLRRYNYNLSTGALVSVVNTTLDGTTPFAPVGAVAVCATSVQADTDFVEEVLCDSNGTAFIRLFRFNSATGTLISTTNTTLAGAAFAPVGAVSTCSNCCPQVVGEGCTNTGSGRYTAIRSTAGTITLIDSVSGATVLAGNIVACPEDVTVQATDQVVQLCRLVAGVETPFLRHYRYDADGLLVGQTDTNVDGTAIVVAPGTAFICDRTQPLTYGDMIDVVSGSPWLLTNFDDYDLDSVTVTVISEPVSFSGSGSYPAVNLPAGFSATWSKAEGSSVLLAPDAITAAPGGRALVHFTTTLQLP